MGGTAHDACHSGAVCSLRSDRLSGLTVGRITAQVPPDACHSGAVCSLRSDRLSGLTVDRPGVAAEQKLQPCATRAGRASHGQSHKAGKCCSLYAMPCQPASPWRVIAAARTHTRERAYSVSPPSTPEHSAPLQPPLSTSLSLSESPSCGPLASSESLSCSSISSSEELSP